MEDPLKVLQALPNLMSLRLYDGYRGEQLHIEGGGFQKLKDLMLRNLKGLNMLIIDEGALPFLEKLEIGPSPLLKEVPSGIHHLKSLKKLKFWEMQTEFILSLQPDEGPNFGKVKHIPFVTFWYRTHGEDYIWYTLGNSTLLKRLRSLFMEDQSAHTTFRKLQVCSHPLVYYYSFTFTINYKSLSHIHLSLNFPLSHIIDLFLFAFFITFIFLFILHLLILLGLASNSNVSRIFKCLIKQDTVLF